MKIKTNNGDANAAKIEYDRHCPQFLSLSLSFYTHQSLTINH